MYEWEDGSEYAGFNLYQHGTVGRRNQLSYKDELLNKTN